MGMQKTIKIDVGLSTPLWPYQVVQVIEDVMQEGERRGKSGWMDVPSSEHLNAAYNHLLGHISPNPFTPYGHQGEDHLTHAFCRLMMAIAIERGYVGKGDK